MARLHESADTFIITSKDLLISFVKELPFAERKVSNKGMSVSRMPENRTASSVYYFSPFYASLRSLSRAMLRVLCDHTTVHAAEHADARHSAASSAYRSQLFMHSRSSAMRYLPSNRLPHGSMRRDFLEGPTSRGIAVQNFMVQWLSCTLFRHPLLSQQRDLIAILFTAVQD